MAIRSLAAMAMALALAAPASSQTAQLSDVDVANAQAVQAHVDAYRSGSLERFVATFAEDATVMVGDMVATGHAEIRAFYASNFESNEHSIQIVESGIVEGRVVITASYHFNNGMEGCCSRSEYEVRDGKIAHLWVTF